MGRLFKNPRTLSCGLALMALLLMGPAHAREPLRLAPGSLEDAPPELIQRLQASPYNYFRFINHSWIARVCDVFAGDLRDLPMVRLHGDAHIEQFAAAKDAWGLDDFDDSARGPAVVDIVRFLGSIDLVARQHFWEKERDALFDRFVKGYMRGVENPNYLPPAPDLVRRLRSQTPKTRAAFLAWGETKMQPLAEPAMKAVIGAMQAFGDAVVRDRPELSSQYFRVVRAGWLQGGVGSALTPKIMVRVRGPSDDPADDELLELKKIGDLTGLPCLEVPSVQPTLRIVDGSKHLGRLKYNIMAAGPESFVPEVGARGQNVRDWWIRSLDPSYRPVSLTDFQSVADVGGVAYDSGVQLGAGRLQDLTVLLSGSDRKRNLAAAVKLEKRYRREAIGLVDDLLRGWQELRAR